VSSEAAAGSLPPRRAFLAAFGCSGAAALFFLVDGGGGGGDDDDDGSGSTFSSLWSFTSEIIRVGMWLAPGSTSKVTSALLPLMDVTLPVSPLPPIGPSMVMSLASWTRAPTASLLESEHMI